MNNISSAIVLVTGIVLVIYGINSLNSFGSDVSTFFTGSPSVKTVLLLLFGLLGVGFGLFGFFSKPKI